MKGLYKFVLLFCVFCNFFSLFILRALDVGGNEEMILYGFVATKFFKEAELEMLIIYFVMLIMSLFVKSPKQNRFQHIDAPTVRYGKSTFYYLVVAFYILIVLFTLKDTNWGLDVSSRGVGQFELENRQSFLQGVASNFYLPFLLYTYHIKFWGKNTNKFVIVALAVYLFHGVAEGGRGGVVSLAIMGFLYLYYIKHIKRKYTIWFGILILFIMSVSASDRFNGDSFIVNTFVKIIQCNSTSEFLAVVKYSITTNIGPFPFMFLMHFVSIFVPSYVLNKLGILSYSRTTFIYDELYNPNPDSGWGFMMLADFYWCFEYYGYILFLLVYYFVLKFFSKNIYSENPAKMVMAIVVVFLFCNQRADFGAFIKPLVYTFIFISILEFFRKKYLKHYHYEVSNKRI